MTQFLVYIIQSTLCLTLFYLFFKVLLSRETFFRFNRFVLLAGMIVCAGLPVIKLKVPQTVVIQEPIAKMERFFVIPKSSNAVIAPKDYLFQSGTKINEYPESAGEIPVSPPSIVPVTIVKITAILYGTGFFVVLFSLFGSIFKMIRIIRKGTKIKRGRYTVVCISKQICPFSWGKYMVLNENDYRQNSDEILIHEEIHARKRHSSDLLFAEFFILFHWFNPVVWLLKRELQNVHEYETDREVINQGIDATKYQLMLVKKAVGARSYAIANSFNHSKIKNRITMMLKRKSTRWARLKLLLFAPLAVVLLQAFAPPETVRIQESLINGEDTTIFEKPKQPVDKPEVRVQEKQSEQQKTKSVLRENNVIITDEKDEILLIGDSIEINFDPIQLEEIKKQMDECREQMDEIKKQMDEDRKQMDEYTKQIDK